MRNAIVAALSLAVAIVFVAGLSYLCAGCADKPAPVAGPPALPKEIAESPLMGPDGTCTPPPVLVHDIPVYFCQGRTDTMSAACVYVAKVSGGVCGIVLARQGCKEPWVLANASCDAQPEEPPVAPLAGEVL